MKALTLHPDYAAYILYGLKQYETRPKSVSTTFRGDLIIHASASWTMVDNYRWSEMIRKFQDIEKAFPLNAMGYRKSPTKGAAICIVTVVDIVPVTDVFDTLTPLEIAVGDYSHNAKNPRYAWKLENVRPLTPAIPAKGQLGLWNWKGDLP